MSFMPLQGGVVLKGSPGPMLAQNSMPGWGPGSPAFMSQTPAAPAATPAPAPAPAPAAAAPVAAPVAPAVPATVAVPEGPASTPSMLALGIGLGALTIGTLLALAGGSK